MLQCPKCGTDNLLNAIFCRGCGEKLELENLKPEAFAVNTQTKAQKIMHLVNIILGIVLTLAILVIVAGALFPASGRITAAEVTEQAQKNYKTLLIRNRSSRSVSFTNEEATALVNQQFSTYTGGKGSPTPEHVTVLFLADGDVRLILTAKLKFLSLHTSVKATPQANGSGTFTLEVKSCKLGMLPLPAGLRPKLVNNFTTIANATLERAKARIGKVTVLEGNVTIERAPIN
ncbi:MAG: hypothetical protein GX564_09400 [Oligosphaeraceae bacterium]|nr:hypothetical protein [Oligosphaeraceae bacterium]